MSWTKEKLKQPFRFDRHKTFGRSGAFCRTGQSAYDPRIWLLKLDKEKLKQPLSSDRHKASFRSESQKSPEAFASGLSLFAQ